MRVKGKILILIFTFGLLGAHSKYLLLQPGDWHSLNEVTPILPSIALKAIDKVPPWLKDDLHWKFQELLLKEIKFNGLVSPVLLDVNSDGLKDLLVGTSDGIIAIFLNVGSQYHPVFTGPKYLYPYVDVVDHATPFVADVDGDGDFDLVFGNNRGKVILYENEGSAGNFVRFKERRDFFIVPSKKENGKMEEIDVGSDSVPVLFDINGDGLLDLVVGSGDGKLHYYENAGTKTRPRWKRIPCFFRGIKANGGAIPVIYRNHKGEITLLLFDGEGKAQEFIYNPKSSCLWEEKSRASKILNLHPVENGRIIPRIVDFDGDLRPDLLVGASSGRIHLIKDFQERIGGAYTKKMVGGSEALGGYDLMKGGPDFKTALSYIYPKYVIAYSNLLLEAPRRFLDELAFSIAHTSAQVLKVIVDNPCDKEGISYSPKVLLDNVRWIYKIARYLPYVKIIEGKGYTTVSLLFKDGKWHKLPKEIYYWYVVHPRIRFEAPSYYQGEFWRSYIFFNGKYGESVRDVVSGAKNVYDAILKIHRWSRTFFEWGEESHDKLPQEPYNANYGSCGEWSIFGVALGRTLLIPTRLANDWGEDHVWNEFYSMGKWHHWDLNFSVAKGIDNPGLYEKNGKTISTIWSLRGDDFPYNISRKYTGTARIIVKVRDKKTNSPLGGTLVLLLSHWALEKKYDKVPLLSFWTTTNGKGEVEIRAGENKYTLLIYKPGFKLKKIVLGDPRGHNGHIIEGRDYEVKISLEGKEAKPKLVIPKVLKKVNIKGKNLKVFYFIYQKMRFPLSYPAKYHYITGNVYRIPTRGKVYYFVCSPKEFEKFRRGRKFKAISFGILKRRISLPSGYKLIFFNPSSYLWARIKVDF